MPEAYNELMCSVAPAVLSPLSVCTLAIATMPSPHAFCVDDHSEITRAKVEQAQQMLEEGIAAKGAGRDHLVRVTERVEALCARAEQILPLLVS